MSQYVYFMFMYVNQYCYILLLNVCELFHMIILIPDIVPYTRNVLF